MQNNRQLYNHLAARYDLRQQNPSTGLLRKKEADLIKKYSKGIAIDLGCGTGCHLDEENTAGLDISEKMLQAAKKKKRPLIQGDIENLPLKENSADTAFCFYSTLNLINFESGIREISRILKENGVAIISVTSAHDMGKKNFGRGNKTKKFRLEGRRIQINLFEKEGIISAFEKNRFRLLHFNSIFRLQKPRWGNFREFSFLEKFKLKLDNLFPREAGNFYFFVFEKVASKTT